VASGFIAGSAPVGFAIWQVALRTRRIEADLPHQRQEKNSGRTDKGPMHVYAFRRRRPPQQGGVVYISSSAWSRSRRGPSRRCTIMSTVDSTHPEVSSGTDGMVS